MATLSTHVLDTARGRPAQGVPVSLEREGRTVDRGVTDQDGRVRELGGRLEPGTWRLLFAVDDYLARQQYDGFYSTIAIQFTVRDDGHYHIPLLLSPYGYSTYRGS
jgi:5-hydroxyisourate hydrolase